MLTVSLVLLKRENKTHSVSLGEINGKEVWFCSSGNWKINSVKRNLTHLEVNAWISSQGLELGLETFMKMLFLPL